MSDLKQVQKEFQKYKTETNDVIKKFQAVNYVLIEKNYELEKELEKTKSVYNAYISWTTDSEYPEYLGTYGTILVGLFEKKKDARRELLRALVDHEYIAFCNEWYREMVEEFEENMVEKYKKDNLRLKEILESEEGVSTKEFQFFYLYLDDERFVAKIEKQKLGIGKKS